MNRWLHDYGHECRRALEPWVLSSDHLHCPASITSITRTHHILGEEAICNTSLHTYEYANILTQDADHISVIHVSPEQLVSPEAYARRASQPSLQPSCSAWCHRKVFERSIYVLTARSTEQQRTHAPWLIQLQVPGV